jgi:hypothetical protein
MIGENTDSQTSADLENNTTKVTITALVLGGITIITLIILMFT